MANAETREKLRTSSIYPKARKGVAVANVLDVFEKTDPSLKDLIGEMYDVRVGYAPDTTGETTIAVSGEVTPRTVAHFDYYSRITGSEIRLTSRSQLNGEHVGALAVPFINTSSVERELQSHGMEVWGMPGVVVDGLKNKANSHELGREFGLGYFQPADHRIVKIGEFQGKTLEYAAQVLEDYIGVGMTRYPLGVMVRAAESDGNYGGCYIREEGDKVVFRPNGSEVEREDFRTWQEALRHGEKYLRATGNALEEVEDRVVVSRLIDLETSPGLASFLIDGQIFPLGWNGQVQEKGDTACTGTSTFVPENDYQRGLQVRYEGETQEMFEKFLRMTFIKYGIDINSVRGTCNVDLMFPGLMERQYQKRKGQETPYWFAEFNPRWTNLTDAGSMVMAVNNWTRSIENMGKVLEGGLYTQDHFHLRKGVDLDQVRDLIEEADSQLINDGGRILVRMYDDETPSLALIFAGDTKLARERMSELALRI